jgi:uncharacterized protein GlcG (DUF336 family)
MSRADLVKALFFWVGVCGLVASAQATELPKRAYLPLTLAQQAAQAALAQCNADGHRVTVAVTDHAGVVLVQLRADGAGPHTISSSARKAYTAASLGRPTLELADFIKDKPALHEIRDMDDKILILGGGLPIKIGNELVGGIGVGGAPGAAQDEVCAQAGLDSIGATHATRP